MKKPNELSGRDPRKKFYMVVNVSFLDGSTDLQEVGDVSRIVDTEIEAVAAADDDEVMDTYVYLCMPIYKCTRGPRRGIRLKATAP